MAILQSGRLTQNPAGMMSTCVDVQVCRQTLVQWQELSVVAATQGCGCCVRT